MPGWVVLVNGLPGSGKSRLSAALGEELPAPVLSKDAVKEALADALPERLLHASGSAAMQACWVLAGAVPGFVVVDSWWFRPRDLEHARAGLRAAGALGAVEVWCEVPVELARERYQARRRHPVHRDDRPMEAEWADWAAGAEPLALTPVLRVDTSVPVDARALAARLRRRCAVRR